MMTFGRCIETLLRSAITDDDLSIGVALEAITDYDSVLVRTSAARMRRLKRLDAAFCSRSEPTFASLVIQMEIASRIAKAVRLSQVSGTHGGAEHSGNELCAPALPFAPRTGSARGRSKRAG